MLMSLPSRERGLKFLLRFAAALVATSLPSRERGLKLPPYNVRRLPPVVAPFAGAWIEIFWKKWILRARKVAPFAGAWIEITMQSNIDLWRRSRSLRGSVD